MAQGLHSILFYWYWKGKPNTQITSSAQEKDKIVTIKKKGINLGTLEKKFILLDITNLTGNLHTIPLTNFRCSSKQKVFFVHKSVNSVISHEMGHLIFRFLFVGIIGVKKEHNQYKARWRKTWSLGGHQRKSKIDQGL